MSDESGWVTRRHGNPYNIFILVLTIMSLSIMFAMLLPVTQEERDALAAYDNIACLIFLGDFFYNLKGARPKRAYLIRGKGWLDLLGSIPSFGVFQWTVLLRLFRLSRLARITRLLRGNNKKMLIADIVQNRGQYALFVTLLLMFIVMTMSSLLVLQFESKGGGSIRTAGDALWWTVVTITTVGYGDFFPSTPGGRLVGVMVMFAGIALIGALASILASLLVSSPSSSSSSETPAADAAEPTSASTATAATATTGPADARASTPIGAEASARVAAALKVHRGEATIADGATPTRDDLNALGGELAALRREIADLRQQLADRSGADTANGTPPAA